MSIFFGDAGCNARAYSCFPFPFPPTFYFVCDIFRFQVEYKYQCKDQNHFLFHNFSTSNAHNMWLIDFRNGMDVCVKSYACNTNRWMIKDNSYSNGHTIHVHCARRNTFERTGGSMTAEQGPIFSCRLINIQYLNACMLTLIHPRYTNRNKKTKLRLNCLQVIKYSFNKLTIYCIEHSHKSHGVWLYN